ncbi:hypothetical protein [Streptomyces litmocidini]|uniref:Uncharacterized protein n=1 Tax=Streptomyces litmocidini TaxID=67318 RepID=A0ABW7UKJ7_9ACTN
MSVRTVLALTGAVLVGGLALAVPAAAEPAVQPVAASVYTLSVGRVASSMAALVGLLGAVNGGLALARTAGRGRLRAWARRNGSVTALRPVPTPAPSPSDGRPGPSPCGPYGPGACGRG